MYWRDSRITSKPTTKSGVEFVSINGDKIHKFWVPDIFIDQAVKTRNPKVHVLPATLRVYPNGVIRLDKKPSNENFRGDKKFAIQNVFT